MLNIKFDFDADAFRKKVMKVAEEMKAEWPCPMEGCRGKIKASISDARAKKVVKCPVCGGRIHLSEEK
jgi:transcription elongation factor Elf1